MTVGEMITEARLKMLRSKLESLLHNGTTAEPQTGEELAAWSAAVDEVRAEIRAMESLQ